MKHGPKLFIAPCNARKANEFVDNIHRHHDPPRGSKFQIACCDEDGLVRGVAIAGRPVARALDDGYSCEVYRVATDGTKNACSCLLSACWRIARAMGYTKIFTYTLFSEPGVSLNAAGWKEDGKVDGRKWLRTDTGEGANTWPTCDKRRWKVSVSKTERPAVVWPSAPTRGQEMLFDL